MPKLSLKKNQQSNASKSQKSITQFFKNTNTNDTKPTQCLSQQKSKSPEISKESGSKRKNYSLTPEFNNKTNDKQDTNYVNNGISSKKIKLSLNVASKLSKINQKLPQKENDVHKSSPEKSFDYDSKRAKNSQRSPLTPVKDLCEDHDNILVEENLQNHKPVVTTQKIKVIPSPVKIKESPSKKNHITAIFRSPQKSPEKLTALECSPSKKGSTVKSLDFVQNEIIDIFGDDWDLEFEEDSPEDLDLTVMQRCDIVNVVRYACRLELKLKNAENKRGTCFVEGVWLDTALSVGDIISVIASRDALGKFCVGNSSGLLTLRPDHLMSSTSVVAGVFCKRKAVLQERWRGIDSANTAMTIGILIHELVQKALTEKISDLHTLRSQSDLIIKSSIGMLYDCGITEEEASSNMKVYINPLAEFMQTYVVGKNCKNKLVHKDQWQGDINDVLDIEENICCPQLGLKGKIDATLQVTIHKKSGRNKTVVPLELKSGKASISAEHRGQLVMYGMMMSLQNNEEPTKSEQRGLLLYLKEKVECREVSCGYPERRDLMMLRNQLVQYLAAGPEDFDPEQISDIEEASTLLQQRLPEPVHHERACSNCAYLTVCSLHLWHTAGPTVSPSHPLSKLHDTALGHLTKEHIKYFLHWTSLLKIEETMQINKSPLRSLWTDASDKRAKRGTCANDLVLKSVEPSNTRFLHTFKRNDENETIQNKCPQEGEFCIVSVDRRPWIAAGVVTLSSSKEIRIILERDLSRRLNKEIKYTIDTYESYATVVNNLTNLGVLIEDSDRADRLRRLIIDKKVPEFNKKLPREVGRIGAKLMKTLNIEQQRAVLKAITAQDYALLQGLPGTGKTQTVSVLIQMLVALKHRVLVTAHTHSAVDTVLTRLPDTLKILRLGSSSRVAPSLLARCEQQLTASCKTVTELTKLNDSMEVVGVTCLGAAHAMLSKSTFDVCIVDEATQVLQCTVLRPLFAAKRFILVGDPEQLPPVVRSRAARRLGMEESLFLRLMREEATSTLQLQYRMNRPLADLANKVAYNDKLKCADEKVAQAKLNLNVQNLPTESWLLKACSPEHQYAAIFLDISSYSSNNVNYKCMSNTDEASVVLELLDAMKHCEVKPSDVGIIAPYRDQVALLRRTSSDVEVSTVDQFQGRDKSVIIYSCTRRDETDHKVKEGEVLNDQRRLAVSVTRARHKFIVIGNSRALNQYAPLQKLFEACLTVHIQVSEMQRVVNKFKNFF